MRPIKLTMQAFASYAKKCTVDFTVPQQNIFLITGDTGAGKSTIFDAIAFALYGVASSQENKKNGGTLRSQYCGDDTETFVELTFRARGKEYTVRRSIKYKGSKKQVERSLVMPDGTEYQPKEADKKIIEIVGLDKAQFMQVAMIAQGEFMEVLRADSNKKKEVFRRLFETGVYQKIGEVLDRRRKDGTAELESMKEKCSSIASELYFIDGVPHETVPDKKSGRDIAELRAMLEASKIECLGDFLKALEGIEGEWKEAEKKAKKESAGADAARNASLAELTEGKMLAESFKEYDRAEEEYRKLEAQSEEHAEKAGLAERAVQAHALRKAYAEAASVKDKETELERRKKEIELLLPKLEENEKKKETESAEADKAAADAARSLAETKERLREFKEEQEELAAAEEEAVKAEKSVSRAVEREGKAAGELKKLKAEIEELQEKSEGLSDAEGMVRVSENHASTGDKLRREAEELKVDEAGLKEDEGKSKAAMAIYEEAKADYDKASGQARRLRSAYLDEQAGILASELEEGRACPVCGSVHHPNPAVLPHGAEEISREKVETAEAAETTASRKAEEAAGEARRLAAEVSASKERIEREKQRIDTGIKELVSAMECAAGYGSGEDLSAVRILERANEAYRIAEQNLKGCMEKADTKKKAEGLIEEKRASQKSAEAELEECRKAMSVAATGKSKADERLSGAQKRLMEAAARGGLLEGFSGKAGDFNAEALAWAEERSRTISEGAEGRSAAAAEKSARTKKELKEAGKELAAKRQELSGVSESLSETKLRREKLTREYEEAILSSGIEEAAWRDLSARCSEEEASRLRTEAAESKEKKSKAEGALETAAKAVSGRQRPNVIELESEYKAAEERADGAAEGFRKAKEERRQLVNAESRLKKLYAEYEEKGKKLGKEARLCDLVNGKVTGARMDLETFVQRRYFSEIIDAANRRFYEMTDGQYQLLMKEIDEAQKGKNKGLDLMVYSAVTGQVRGVETLSGGESFMAALSMALGTSDRIAEANSAAAPEILFIDEGFGSLDDRSRAQAVKVLKEMAGTKTLVGIISHVTELSRELDDQLVVTKDGDGSHAKWA